ncbi:MAG: class I SAM-dependent methyltransferase [Candidatus Omnitrophica bacterium]|nr:class I SAM-dependent methyltransferase [Candidatus Omnitrophota bacterium]
MSEPGHNRMADQYFEASYGRGNLLTPEQFTLACEYFRRDYKSVMPSRKDAAILDVGCGAGHFLYYLKTDGYQNYFGIDVSSGQIAYCQKHITDRVKLVDAVSFLEQNPQRYDLIVAHDVGEHIPKAEVMKFLDCIFRSLKPEGRLILRVPNMSNPFGLDARYNDFTHEIGYTAKSLYQVLYVVGFRDIQILPPREIPVRNYRNFIRKHLVKCLHRVIRFCYYIQDYTVPENLDKNIVAVARKTGHE